MRAHTFLLGSVLGLGLAVVLATAPARADQHKNSIRPVIESHINKWLDQPSVVEAIKRQNAEHASLDVADIDRLDKRWRAQTKLPARPLIDEVLSRPLSRYLQNIKREGRGLYTEIFVMDNRGLNVGQSDVTSDYWQGDEAKWKKTFLVGPKAVYIGDVEEDESTQQFQSQVSLAIVDPATNDVIGAVTVGIDVEILLEATL